MRHPNRAGCSTAITAIRGCHRPSPIAHAIVMPKGVNNSTIDHVAERTRALGKPLTEQAKGSNRTKSSVRVRVEHVFGAQTNDMGGTLVRTIGMVRAKAKIGMKNLAYNMRRLVQLRRLDPCPA